MNTDVQTMNDSGGPRPGDLLALRVLDEIGRNPSITQRELSRRMGISLGFTNLLLRRMARKGWFKVRTIPGRRVLYALTPQGLSEKLRKTRDFVRFTWRYYNDLRSHVAARVKEIGKPHPSVCTLGAGELAGIVAEGVSEAGGRYEGEAQDRRVDAVICFVRPTREQQAAWERSGTALIDLS